MYFYEKKIQPDFDQRFFKKKLEIPIPFYQIDYPVTFSNKTHQKVR